MSAMPSATIEAAAARVLAFGRQRLARYPECSNIASPIGLAQYLAIAAEVAAWTGPGRILNWGAGWGNQPPARGERDAGRGVRHRGQGGGLGTAPRDRRALRRDARTKLPFAEGEFDAVLNSGVLERVGDKGAALAELRRVLRPGGRLLHVPPAESLRVYGMARSPARTAPPRSHLHAARGLGRVREGGVPRPELPSLPRAAAERVGTSVRAAVTGALDRCGLRSPRRRLERLPRIRGLATAWAVVADRTP